MTYKNLFNDPFPVIACVHLQPLPGSPDYSGELESIYERAIQEAKIFESYGCRGIIVENFGDSPFYKDSVPPITTSAMSIAIHKISEATNIPIGVNVLRNDAKSAICIATACFADFVRINIHMHARLTDQGIIEGKAYDTLRLKKQLGSKALIFADINVKHSAPLAHIPVDQGISDLILRGKADAIIVTGSGTGASTDMDELREVKSHSSVPVLIGSGTNPNNIKDYQGLADGAIVGSYFKVDGLASNPVDADRVKKMMSSLYPSDS